MKTRKWFLIALAVGCLFFAGSSYAHEDNSNAHLESDIRSYLLDCLQWADESIAQASIQLTYDETNSIWYARITTDKKMVWRNEDTVINLENIDETKENYILNLIIDEDGKYWGVRTAKEYLDRKNEQLHYNYNPDECARIASVKLQTLFGLSQETVDSLHVGYGDVYTDEKRTPLVTILFNDHETGASNEWLYAAIVNAGTGEALDCIHRDMLWERLPAHAEKYSSMSDEYRRDFLRWNYYSRFNPFGGISNWTDDQKQLWYSLFN